MPWGYASHQGSRSAFMRLLTVLWGTLTQEFKGERKGKAGWLGLPYTFLYGDRGKSDPLWVQWDQSEE